MEIKRIYDQIIDILFCLIEDMRRKKPFIAFVRDNATDFIVYLVNPSGMRYAKVKLFTGAYCGDEDGLLETSKVIRDKDPLSPLSFIRIDSSDIYELDFVIWYDLDLTDAIGRKWQYAFSLPKGGYSEDAVLLPTINKEGWRIDLDERKGASIEELAKTTNMKGGYYKSGE